MHPITSETSKYFLTAKYWYKITWFTLMWIIVYTQISKVLNINAIMTIVNSILVVFPMLGIYIMVPAGFVYILKSYVAKEP
jgi:hypothetical protein